MSMRKLSKGWVWSAGLLVMSVSSLSASAAPNLKQCEARAIALAQLAHQEAHAESSDEPELRMTDAACELLEAKEGAKAECDVLTDDVGLKYLVTLTPDCRFPLKDVQAYDPDANPLSD